LKQDISPNRRAELVVLACLCALCGFMALTAFGYSLRDALGPGAGFFPFWLGTLGVVLSLALFVQSWRGRAIGEGTQALLPRGEGARRAAALVAGLVAVSLLLQPLGFRLAMLVFTVGLLLALGVRRPVTIAIFALASSFGLFHVFYYWLQVPLPIGVLGI
jgi:putative tricarboxylic transport membrane protein